MATLAPAITLTFQEMGVGKNKRMHLPSNWALFKILSQTPLPKTISLGVWEKSGCGFVCLFESGSIAIPMIKHFVSEKKGEWLLSKQQTVSAAEIKLKTELVDGIA